MANVSSNKRTVAEHLFQDACHFDFFQAVHLLERLFPEGCPLGRDVHPSKEIVRLRVHQTVIFPASEIYDLVDSDRDVPVPTMIVNFMGLTGPLGVLPLFYTDLLMGLEREAVKAGEKRIPLRDWLDIFNHRFSSLFYRAWEKYRFYVAFERDLFQARDFRDAAVPQAEEPDLFTLSLFCLVGLGERRLRNRLRVASLEYREGKLAEKSLARIEDLAFLHYGGFFAHRPRNALSLEALLNDFFALPFRILQFQGQWLVLDAAKQTRLGAANSDLGKNVVAGERVWDVQNKVRVRLGPISYAVFAQFLPDREPVAERKSIYLLSHLVRLYIGPELDFDIQLILRKEDIPACHMNADAGVGPQLGRNTWVACEGFTEDADDAVFEGETVVFVNRTAHSQVT